MLTRVGRVAFAILAAALTAAAVRFDVATPSLTAYGGAALAAGALLAVAGMQYAIPALIFVTPLLGIIPRIQGVRELSMPEHMLLPLLVIGMIRVAWRATPRPPTAIDRPLAIYMAMIGVSAAWGLWEYCALGEPLWDGVIGPAMNRHFAYGIWDFANGRFLIVHYTLVALEGALWLVLLTASGASVRAGQVRAALIWSAVAVALVGGAQSVWHFGMIEFFQRMQPELNRINATFPDPNTFGSFLVLVLPIGLVASLEQRSGRWLAAAWVLLCGYCIIRSVSRTAWGGLAVASGAAAVAGAWQAHLLGVQPSLIVTRWLRRALVTAGSVAVLGALLVSLGLVGRGINYNEARSPSDMLLFTLNVRRPANELMPSRVDHWHAALNIWEDFPFFGAGIGKYPLLKNRYLPEARARWMFFTDAHNYFLKVLCELGIIGLVGFLTLLASFLLQARRAHAVADAIGRRRVAAAVLGLIGFLVSCLGQDPLILREIQYVFWAVVALLVMEERGAAGAT